MSESIAGLTADPLFVGATRPPMRWGVTYSALLFNMVFVMFGSIRSVAVSAMSAFEHVQAQRATPFSVRRWVKGRTAPGILFIPYKAAHISALRSMIATWMRIAIFEAMNGAENSDQRLWFVIDELDALGAIDGLKDALARLRKFGGRCVLGFQSVAQVSSTYGAGDAQTIIENCGSTLILRCSASESGAPPSLLRG